MKKNELEKELINLTKLGFINDDQLENITNNYLSQKDSSVTSKSLLIFSLLGITFVGSGIVFLFSYNWSIFSIPIKIVISLIPLLCTQVLLFYKFYKKASQLWIELSCLAVAIAFVCAIILLSNTFQLNYDISLFIVITVLMLSPLVYVCNSYYLSIAIFAITIIVWGVGTFTPSLLSLVALVPYYFIRKKSVGQSSILAVLCAIFFCSLPFALHDCIDTNYLDYVVLCIVFYFAYASCDSKVRYIAKIVLYAYLFFLVVTGELHMYYDSLDWIIITSIVLVVAIYCIVYKNKKYNGLSKIDFIAIITTFVLFVLWMALFTFVNNDVLEIIYTYILKAFLIVLCVAKILFGMKDSNMNSITRYLLVLSVYLYFEFMNFSDNLLYRGIFLIIMGSLFFLANYLILKKVRNEK